MLPLDRYPAPSRTTNEDERADDQRFGTRSRSIEIGGRLARRLYCKARSSVILVSIDIDLDLGDESKEHRNFSWMRFASGRQTETRSTRQSAIVRCGEAIERDRWINGSETTTGIEDRCSRSRNRISPIESRGQSGTQNHLRWNLFRWKEA